MYRLNIQITESTLICFHVLFFRSSASIDDESQLLNLLSVFYHKTRRNTLILLYAQDILILDLDIKQTISIVSLERSTCPFLEVICSSTYIHLVFFPAPNVDILESNCFMTQHTSTVYIIILLYSYEFVTLHFICLYSEIYFYTCIHS